MSERFQRNCRMSGCPMLTRDRAGYCEKHIAHAGDSVRKRNKMRRENDPIWREMYETARWKHFRRWLINQNPICQRLIGGVQCTNPSYLVHHCLSPRIRPDLFVEARNCVCLCGSGCHPNTESTPNWKAGVDFCETAFSLPSFGLQPEEK